MFKIRKSSLMKIIYKCSGTVIRYNYHTTAEVFIYTHISSAATIK